MIIKFLFTVFFLTLNFFILKRIKGTKTKQNQWILLAAYFFLITSLNVIVKTISLKLVAILILFSLSLFLLNFFKSFVSVYERSNFKGIKKLTRVKDIMLNVFMPIMITIFQIIAIWNDEKFDHVIKNRSKKIETKSVSLVIWERIGKLLPYDQTS